MVNGSMLQIIFYLILFSFQEKPIYSHYDLHSGNILIEGDSMYPLLKNGDIVSYTKTISWNIARNSIIFFQNGSKFYVKRIVGIPWDNLLYTGGYIYINSVPQRNTIWEYYVINSQVLSLVSQDFSIIPENAYLVFWNKPHGTNDSSVYWFIMYDQILWVLKNKQ